MAGLEPAHDKGASGAFRLAADAHRRDETVVGRDEFAVAGLPQCDLVSFRVKPIRIVT
jgi:hypothetical protein